MGVGLARISSSSSACISRRSSEQSSSSCCSSSWKKKMGKIFIEKRRRFSSSISVSTTTRMMIEGMENLTTSDIHQQMSHIFDVATGVGLPCTVQNCGDMIYRSTLDPELRRELKPLFTAQGAALLSTLFIFLSITPGALPG